MKSRVWSIAEQELADAASWYENQREGLGLEFLDEYESKLNVLEDDPTRFPKLDGIPDGRPIHRCRLERFPYMIVYELLPNELVILAVVHLHRHPEYLIDRLR